MYAIIVWDDETREYSVATERRYDTEEEAQAAADGMTDGGYYRVSRRCSECDGKMIGCDHPYCPDCRDRETAARQQKNRTNAQRRCRDCGAYGPTDARSLGRNCGCASE